jgi:hypothetical protein
MGRGRVSISAHLWGTDRRVRFKERENLGGARSMYNYQIVLGKVWAG